LAETLEQVLGPFVTADVFSFDYESSDPGGRAEIEDRDRLVTVDLPEAPDLVAGSREGLGNDVHSR
ncbi:MAG: hypothetical protein ACOCY8_04975, partial [Spirochaetota bacterium]